MIKIKLNIFLTKLVLKKKIIGKVKNVIIKRL